MTTMCRIDIEELQSDIADFLNDAGCVVPSSALDLIQRSGAAIPQLIERVSTERARGNRLQDEADLLRDSILQDAIEEDDSAG